MTTPSSSRLLLLRPYSVTAHLPSCPFITLFALAFLALPCASVTIPSLDLVTKTMLLDTIGGTQSKIRIDLDKKYPIDTRVALKIISESDGKSVYYTMATATSATSGGAGTGAGANFIVSERTSEEGTYTVVATCASSHCDAEEEARVVVAGVRILEGASTSASSAADQDAAAGTAISEATDVPTSSPTKAPTSHPTNAPASAAPTASPTSSPLSSSPTRQPTNVPTFSPTTKSPTLYPTSVPTRNTSPTVSFSSHFADSMVLQRSPSSSVVYGTIELDPATMLSLKNQGPMGNMSSLVQVDVMLQGSEGHLQTSIVPATITITGDTDGDTRGSPGGSSLTANLVSFTAILPPVGTSSSVINTLKRTSPPSHSYTIYARCKLGCIDDPDRSNVASIHDVKFGDVWVCMGEGDMGVPLEYTFSRNASAQRVRHGGYSNVRYKSLGGYMGGGGGMGGGGEEMQWSKPTDALAGGAFLNYSAACYYFAESLVDRLGTDAPPIGLLEVARPSSRIEDWMDDAAVDECSDTLPKLRRIYETTIVPIQQLSIKGWVWYQGSSDMVGRFGNATHGYACLLPKMIASYRQGWSHHHPGTTSPDAPFGIVTLHPSGARGYPDAGGMRLAQTAGYGTIPNPAMPNTFAAQAYDLNDPFDDATCYDRGCCDRNIVFGNTEKSPTPCVGGGCDICGQCGDYCETLRGTNFFAGPANPRPKRFVGERLARSAAVEVYGKPGDGVGPTLAGCRRSDDTIIVHFRRKLLGGEKVVVREYDEELTMSKMEVLVDPDAFCIQTRYVNGNMICVDDGTGNAEADDGSGGRYNPGSGAWMPVDIESAGPAQIRVNLTKSGGVAHAIRYGWDGTCCSYDPSGMYFDGTPKKACPVASCPIVGNDTLLPADPFVARIVGGKCECLSPQNCDASIGLQAFRFRIKDIPVTEKSFLIASGSLLGLIFLICCMCMCRAMLVGGQSEKEGYEMVNLNAIPEDDDEADEHEVW